MSEELLSNARWVKNLTPTGIRTIELPIHNLMHWPLGYHTLL